MPRLKKVSLAKVSLWGKPMGVVAWDENRSLGTFEYEKAFQTSGLEAAPLTMPLGPQIFSFPQLAKETFRGLPGLLADALPDRFGNAIVAQWLKTQKRDPDSFSPVEHLCYMGTRAMGALEFHPAMAGARPDTGALVVDEMRALAARILATCSRLSARMRGKDLAAIIRIGTSAGGARAKAILAWNPRTNEVRAGDGVIPKGFEPWILKFDGVKDAQVGDPEGFGRIEYVYHLMAVNSGIQMSPCRLFEEGGRAHFMTRRFDRAEDGAKIHVQSLCAMRHYDFNLTGAFGYEQALETAQALKLEPSVLEEITRRMVFNVVARNQDDHTRNFAFLMGQDGRWSLAPAFDVIWSHNPEGNWTFAHQMTINGKRTSFNVADILAATRPFGIKRVKAIIDSVIGEVSKWPVLAKKHGLPAAMTREVGRSHRLQW